jgi:hypothetical protein
LLLASAALAQEVPQFIWQGEVDGIVYLHLGGNKLAVQVGEGAAVARQQFRFQHALTDVAQDARLSVLEGRGYVHVTEQPRLENHYTLTVAIEDRQPGSAFYSIALYWDASNRFFEKPREGRSEHVQWSGRVDEEALVSCGVKRCVASSSRGAPASEEHFKFSRPMPERPVEVELELRQGRGQIRLVEQPSEQNHYQAVVSIRDPQSGSSEYSFSLLWTRSKEKGPEIAAVGPGLIWSGGVAGRVRITVRGGAAASPVIKGRPLEGERAEFLRPLPSRSDLHPVAKKLRGRGNVAILELPSEQNNYQLVFEIDDPGPAVSSYEVEIDW